MDHEHEGVPQRPPAYAHLLIDSKDRDPNADKPPYPIITTPANNFLIDRNQALLYGYLTRLAITQLQFNWRLPTVMTGINNVFIIAKVAPAPAVGVVQLTQGYYNPTTLAAEIETQLQGVAGFATYTCVYDANLGGFQFSSNNGDTFSFVPLDIVIVQYPLLAKAISRTYRLLGLSSGNIDVLSAATVQITGTPNMLYTDYVDICSRNLTKYQRVKDIDTAGTNTKSFIIARLYLCPTNQRNLYSDTDAPGALPFDICVDYNTPKHIRWSPQEAVNQIDLQVYDEFGELLPWDVNNYNWDFQLTLVASET